MSANPIYVLGRDLFEHPCPSLILAAYGIMVDADTDTLPGWLLALANGNLELWQDVIAAAQSFYRGDRTEVTK